MIDQKAFSAASKIFQTKPLQYIPWKRVPNVTYIAALSFEASRAAGSVSYTIKRNCRIKYTDSMYRDSEREVILHSAFVYAGDLYLDCYCLMRGEIRTFASKGISAFDAVELSGLKKEVKIDILSAMIGLKNPPFDSDYFVHPSNFRRHVKPISILKRRGEDGYFDEDRLFGLVLSFCDGSFRRSYWRGWATDQKAISLALAGMSIDVSYVDWRSELQTLKSRNFSFVTFMNIINNSEIWN